MCDQQRLRPVCAYAQTDQSICKSLEYFMNVQLLTEQHLEFLSLKGAAQADLSLHLSKGHIVRNHMSRLICLKQDVGYSCSSETAELHCIMNINNKPQTPAPFPHKKNNNKQTTTTNIQLNQFTAHRCKVWR